MIAERFDESVVLLSSLLNVTLDHVAHLRLNTMAEERRYVCIT